MGRPYRRGMLFIAHWSSHVVDVIMSTEVIAIRTASWQKLLRPCCTFLARIGAWECIIYSEGNPWESCLERTVQVDLILSLSLSLSPSRSRGFRGDHNWMLMTAFVVRSAKSNRIHCSFREVTIVGESCDQIQPCDTCEIYDNGNSHCVSESNKKQYKSRQHRTASWCDNKRLHWSKFNLLMTQRSTTQNISLPDTWYS